MPHEDDDMDDEGMDIPTVEEPPAPAPSPASGANGASANGAGHRRAGPRTRQPIHSGESREDNAVFVWESILSDLASKGRHPNEIVIYVSRIEPPPEVSLGNFGGDSVADGGDALFAFIANYYHARATSRAPSLYQVRFHWRGNTKFARLGKLRMPPPDELAGMGAPRAYGVAGSYAGTGAPPPQQHGQHPGYYPTPHRDVFGPGPYSQPQPYGYPPQLGGPPPGYVPQAALDQERQHQERIATLRVELAQAEAAAAAAKTQAAGVGAPPAATGTNATVVAVIEVLRQMGVIPAAAAALPAAAVGVGSAAAAATPAAAAATAAAPAAPATAVAARTAISELATLVSTVRGLKGIGRELESLFGGDAEPAAEVVSNPITVEEEKPILPFDAIPIPEVTLGGHQVHYARNRETGKLDLEGTLFSNPLLAEKIIGVGEVLVKAVAAGLGKAPGQQQQQPAAQQQSEIVQHIPAEARDASPAPAADGTPGESPWPAL